MVSHSGQALAQPSALGSDGASFTIIRTASTSTQIVSPFVRSGRHRVVIEVHGRQSHSREDLAVDLAKDRRVIIQWLTTSPQKPDGTIYFMLRISCMTFNNFSAV